jgi:ABC-2 type transport system permease protein
VLDFMQLLPALLIVYLLHPVPLVWVLAATFAVFATLVAANCIGVFIANFTSSPADVLLYATAILLPLIYVSGFFRNQNPTGALATIRDFVPFAYANDALKTVFGVAAQRAPLEVFAYPTLICAVFVVLVCLTAPGVLSEPSLAAPFEIPLRPPPGKETGALAKRSRAAALRHKETGVF